MPMQMPREQLTIDDAIAARDKGMQQALDHAEEEVKHWRDLALVYLSSFARSNRGVFTGEDVCDASKEAGLIQPPTDKAWGSVMRKGALRGLIEKVDNEGVRRKGHASPCPRWRSLIFGRPQ